MLYREAEGLAGRSKPGLTQELIERGSVGLKISPGGPLTPSAGMSGTDALHMLRAL